MLRPVPNVVEVVCDECGHYLEHGGEGELLVEPAHADDQARDYGWRVLGGKHICTSCQEEKGQEVNE